tara:strand:+ start:249 stop:1583 length:1335 start_codon:yes stop_codon:yes gene_type:complete
MTKIKDLIILFISSLFLFASAQAMAKTKITWWNYSSEESGLNADLKSFIQDEFNASQDEIELEIIFKDGDYNDLTRIALIGGVGPDLVSSSGPTYVQAYADGGFVLPLDDYSEQYGWKEKLLPWAYEAGVFKGKFYAFPKNYESMLYFYNKTLFEENGWDLPSNLSEYESLAQKIQDKGMYPFAYGSSGWQPTHEHLVGNYFNNVAGPDNLYKALIGEKKWTDPEFVQSLELLNKHMMDGYWSGGLDNYYSVGWDEMFFQFVNREAAMMQIGTWGFGDTSGGFAEKSDDWGWAPLPNLTNEGGNPNYQLSVGGAMSINSASKNPDAAAAVLDWIISDKARVLELTAARNYGEWLMPLKYEASDFSADVDQRIKDYLIDFADRTGKGDYGYTTWTYYPGAANEHLYKSMEEVWAGSITIAEYLEEQQALWDEARSSGSVSPIGQR